MKMANDEKYVVPEAAPKDRPFMFVVKTANGDIAEFDEEGNEKNFREINKDEAKGLYLIGRGVKFGFDTDNGIFDILGSLFTVRLAFDSESIQLTGVEGEKYNDIIQYKGFISEGMAAGHVGPAQLACMTTSFHIGWKKKIVLDENRHIFVKVIFSIIMNEGMQIEVKVSPNFNIGNGCITVDNGKQEIGRTIRKLGPGASQSEVIKIK
jgi:hypothetical protein